MQSVKINWLKWWHCTNCALKTLLWFPIPKLSSTPKTIAHCHHFNVSNKQKTCSNHKHWLQSSEFELNSCNRSTDICGEYMQDSALFLPIFFYKLAIKHWLAHFEKVVVELKKEIYNLVDRAISHRPMCLTFSVVVGISTRKVEALCRFNCNIAASSICL